MRKDKKQDHLRTWLDKNKDVLKSGGFAERANYDRGDMTRFMKGRDLPEDVYRSIVFECKKFGYEPEEE